MKTLGWILCGVAAAAVLYALQNAVALVRLYREMQRMRKYSDPQNMVPLDRGIWSIVFAYSGFVWFLGAGIVLGLAGGFLLIYS